MDLARERFAIREERQGSERQGGNSAATNSGAVGARNAGINGKAGTMI